jgi:hypothetical protein
VLARPPRTASSAPALSCAATLPLWVACSLLFACQGGGTGGGGAEIDGGAGALGDAGTAAPGFPAAPPDAGPAASGWVTVAEEGFERLDPSAPAWHPDPVPDDGPFADSGVYFTRQGIRAPSAWRLSQPLGEAGWLTAESYTRTSSTPFSRLVSVVADPADPANHVLKVASPAHTDATVIRSSAPLPHRYRVSLRVGFPLFGDGKPGLNGYATGLETAEPWWPDLADTQNGFYLLTILDAVPRPHNNTWIHHHRKVVMDADNNQPPWTEIWNGDAFVVNGEHPVSMRAIDGRGAASARTGKPFLAYANGAWQPSGAIRIVDSYLPGAWYRVAIERFDTRFTMEISGTFRYGGDTTYRAVIDAEERCIWHFNRSAAEDASACVDESPYDTLGSEFPQWPAGATWPDYFMFGDPHENYYMGEVLYDDVKLETWQP